MRLTKDFNILIVGLGLMGGSYAMALRKKGYHVEAIARRQETIDYALEHGLIDRGAAEPDPDMIGKADLVVSGLYPAVFIDWVKNNQKYFKSGAFLTDVTGVKTCVVYTIQDMLRPDVEFIAAHPMAGREVYGVENADDRIFGPANYIVVPTGKNTEDAIELCRSLGEELGFASISVLTPEKHDEMIAFLSQLTHCIAVSLMCSSGDPELVHYTGDSFRDLTRIAKINENMWSELFLDNKDALLREMGNFRSNFDRLYDCIRDDDTEGMKEMMRLSTKRRKLFDRK